MLVTNISCKLPTRRPFTYSGDGSSNFNPIEAKTIIGLKKLENKNNNNEIDLKYLKNSAMKENRNTGKPFKNIENYTNNDIKSK